MRNALRRARAADTVAKASQERARQAREHENSWPRFIGEASEAEAAKTALGKVEELKAANAGLGKADELEAAKSGLGSADEAALAALMERGEAGSDRLGWIRPDSAGSGRSADGVQTG